MSANQQLLLGEGAGGGIPNYIEDVFSTYLYTGNSAAQTITNGLDISGTFAYDKIGTTEDMFSGSIVPGTNDFLYAKRVSSTVVRFYRQGQYETELTGLLDLSVVASCVDSSGNAYFLLRENSGGITYSSVAKLPVNGASVTWYRRITNPATTGASPTNITTDGTSVFVCGNTGDPYYEGFVVKLNASDGTIAWQKVASAAYGAYFYAICTDSSGNVYVAGQCNQTGSYSEGYIVKLNSSGVQQNSTAFYAQDIAIYDIRVDASGNIYVSGTSTSQEYFIRKFNSSFTAQWHNHYTVQLNGATSGNMGLSVGTNRICMSFEDNTGLLTFILAFDTSGTLQSSGVIPGNHTGNGKVGVQFANGTHFLFTKDGLYAFSDTVLGTGTLPLVSLPAITPLTRSFTAGSAAFIGSSAITEASVTPSMSKIGSYSLTSVAYPQSVSGGLVWMKSRDAVPTNTNHNLVDTVRGAGKPIYTNGSGGQLTQATLVAFNTNGFRLGNFGPNESTATYASWSFREQAKFFDIVTYTGNGANRTIAHNLGAVPGCIIVKRTDTTANWQIYHRSLANTEYLVLNSIAAKATGATRWNSTTPTSSVFSVGTDASVNASGGTYVAYIYAHDAGGFGLSGSDNVISCGSYTGNGSTTGPVVTLGYEPQWLMVKRTDDVESWNIADNMRGLWVGDTSTTSNSPRLRAELASAEQGSGWVIPTATGFQLYGPNAAAGSYNASGGTYIYIAIRRGPMKVPTVGTSVFSVTARAGTSANTSITSLAFPPDLAFNMSRNRGANGNYEVDRLRGNSGILNTVVTSAENYSNGVFGLLQTGFNFDSSNWLNGPYNFVNWVFRRSPSFFDMVCYTGTGANTTQTHNLGVVPELMIVKGRSGATAWQVYSSGIANTEYLVLSAVSAKTTGTTRWNSTTPTSSVFSLGTASEVNTSTATYVAYLFATVAGVSKVGSYTGTATTLQVNCGFTAGARFVLIKRTDSTGDWYVWDSARGIIAGNDPYLLWNDSADEVTGTDYVDTYSAGFEISSTAPAAINASGGTFIFLAIA
jgi:hypothetical protein